MKKKINNSTDRRDSRSNKQDSALLFKMPKVNVAESAATSCNKPANARRVPSAVSTPDVPSYPDLDSLPPFDPSKYEPLEVKQQTPEEIRATAKRFKITESDASYLLMMRHLASCSMLYSDSNGGGRYPRYCRKLERKYNLPFRSIF